MRSNKKNKIINACLSSSIALLLAVCSLGAHATVPYLEDADTTIANSGNAAAPDISDHLWPRIMMAETQTLSGDSEQYSKYRIIAASAHSIIKIEELQKDNPELLFFRTINPNEYLGYNDETLDRLCPQGHGNPFSTTTAATENCGVYAGHWLYEAGSPSTAAITASATTIRVNDISRFNTGEFAVIYNAPAGSFNNAEHVKIISRNTSTRTLTIERGFKSHAVAHASGSIVAQHARGFGNPNPRNWRYNLSTQSPTDANGRTYGQVLPIWIEQNISRDLIGRETEAKVSGILFDSDFHYIFQSQSADVNNDLVVDNGVSPIGINWYGLGMQQFYERVRDRFPNLILSGGIRDSRAFATLNGTQFEGFPGFADFFSPDPEYDNINALLNNYSLNTRHRSTGPAHSHILSKTASKIYPFNVNPANATNRTFRFALGLTLLEDGYFGFRNDPGTPDVWFDEYAVDVTRGSQNYGRAIPSTPDDEAKVRAHRGWLGQPRGARSRIYSDSEFATNQALLSGTFDNNINNWEGIQLNVSRTTDVSQDGSGSLRVSNHVGGYQEEFDAAVRGPITSVSNGREYTLVFAARATSIREMSVSIGGHTERFYLRPEWQRYVMTFRSEQTGQTRPRFNLGRENTIAFLDTVHFFEGNANVFRRDFDNGIVVVNATNTSQTIPLNGTFQRIRGQQDSSFNNGSFVSNITLNAFDSAILVRGEANLPRADSQPPWININSPTKLRVGPITDTTIVVSDQLAINASSVQLSPDNTAGVSNFNCVQANVRQVNCSLNITSTGDLQIRATDAAGNRSVETESAFQINGGTTGDGTPPVMIITAPTRTSNSTITNTTVRITDNIEIDADDIEVLEETTAGVSNFNCQQGGATVVNCTMRITRSGDLRLMATDLGGNVHRASINGYVINNSGGGSTDTSRPNITITAPTKVSNNVIRDTTIVAEDNIGINVQSVELRNSSTADTANFNCQQDGATKVRCTVDIVSSGNITVRAIDNAGNEFFRSENNYQINSTTADTTRPFFIVNAPTKTSRSTITDTSIIVRDNVAISASDVSIRDVSTVGTNSFRCVQRTLVEVLCTLNITSSGDLQLIANDRSGNTTFRSENGYIILDDLNFMMPVLKILLLE